MRQSNYTKILYLKIFTSSCGLTGRQQERVAIWDGTEVSDKMEGIESSKPSPKFENGNVHPYASTLLSSLGSNLRRNGTNVAFSEETAQS